MRTTKPEDVGDAVARAEHDAELARLLAMMMQAERDELQAALDAVRAERDELRRVLGMDGADGLGLCRGALTPADVLDLSGTPRRLMLTLN